MSVLSSSTSDISKSTLSLTPRVDSVQTSLNLQNSNENQEPSNYKSQRDYETFKHSVFQKLTFREHQLQEFSAENKKVISESSFIDHIINPDEVTNLVIKNNIHLNQELIKIKKRLGDMILLNKLLDDENKKLSDEFTMMKLEQTLK
ncbi:hypothetical protein QEN19_000645 [Hanseniaspora menglaensis]